MGGRGKVKGLVWREVEVLEVNETGHSERIGYVSGLVRSRVPRLLKM